jgi:SNF2 family DNA or RNA helicase
VDRQAEDRCHRLGQDKQVMIYRLIMDNSIEEHMMKMANNKKTLNDVMLEEGAFIQEESSETKQIVKLFEAIFG